MAREVARKMVPEVARKMAPEVARKMAPEVARKMAPEVAHKMAPEVARKKASEVPLEMARETLREIDSTKEAKRILVVYLEVRVSNRHPINPKLGFTEKDAWVEINRFISRNTDF